MEGTGPDVSTSTSTSTRTTATVLSSPYDTARTTPATTTTFDGLLTLTTRDAVQEGSSSGSNSNSQSVFVPTQGEAERLVDAKVVACIVYLCEASPTSCRLDSHGSSTLDVLSTDALSASEAVVVQERVAARVHFLISYSNQTKSTISFRAKTRALHAVLRLTTPDVLADQLDLVYPTFITYCRQCSYMVEFEALRLPHSLPQLIHGDATALLRGLWQQSLNNQARRATMRRSVSAEAVAQTQACRLLELIATMGVTLAFPDPLFWTALLRAMHKASMTRRLLRLLPSLGFLTWVTMVSADV